MKTRCETKHAAVKSITGAQWVFYALCFVMLAVVPTSQSANPSSRSNKKTAADATVSQPVAPRSNPVTHSTTSWRITVILRGIRAAVLHRHHAGQRRSLWPASGFRSNLPDFRHVVYAEEGKEFRILKDNTFFVSFDANADVAQDKTFRVRPVLTTPGKEIVYTIHINWMTRKAFAKAGGFRKSDIVKVSCEPRMSFGTNKPENWRTAKPGKSDIASPKNNGHCLQGITSDYEKAKILTKALMRGNWAARWTAQSLPL